MKKLFLTLAAAMVGMSAVAASPFSVENSTKLIPGGRADFRSVEITGPVTNDFKVASRSESADEVNYSLAGEPYTALAFNNQRAGMQEAMAFQIDPSFLSNVTDGEITEISFYTGTDDVSNTNRVTKACVFITDNLTGDFLYTQEVTVTTSPFTKVSVPLDTPFSIPSNSKVYVGVYYTITGADNMVLVTDYMGHTNNYGGWVAYRSNSRESWVWDNISSEYGFFTLGATIKANGLPKNSVSILQIAGQPVAYEYDPFPVTFLLQNNGINDVNNITVEFGFDGEESVTETFDLEQPLPINQLIIGTADVMATKPTKSTNVNINIKAINGEANNAADASASYPVSIVAAGKGLQRNVVIEEFTSISCVYCPVGYTAMEQIHEDYKDGSIIPVCIHVNSPGTDPMTATSFNSVVNRFCTQGVPSSTINRTYSVYPLFDDLVETAEEIMKLPGLGHVSAEATLNREAATVTVNTQTTFAFDYTDGDKNFILAYAITEDGVGPYTQKNGYAGVGQDVPGGWQNQPTDVKLIYNDVARQLDRYSGITGSVPAEITAGESYSYTHDVKLNNAVGDPDNINLVVYLINRVSGAIENACTIKNVGNQDASGIETVTADSSDATGEYFNLQGVKVSNPSNGIYILRQGKNVTKVYVK